MPFVQYLNQDRILEIVGAFTDGGLVKNATLDELLTSLPPAYAAALPQDGAPLGRLMITLNDLNRTERLIDGTVPFVLWLRSAVLYAGSKPKPLDVINRALATVSGGGAGGPPPNFSGKNERIVGTNDLLPFDFLRRGAEAGRSVAKLTVSRYDNGQPTRANGVPVRHLGTGWLLSPALLITNHHVVNARDDGEPDASAGDLALQAQSVEVQFDYEATGATVPSQKVAALEAFAPLGGPLDYAILRLQNAVDRKPLSIATTPLTLPPSPDSYPSVNIIQHPQGDPKMVACRNNLVTRADGAQLWYFTDTMRGSSGAPVLDDRWMVIALHKKWDYLSGVTYQGRDTAWANQGTQMFAIVDHLRATGKAGLLAELGLA
jgi:endonuclease G, mitochondrial